MHAENKKECSWESGILICRKNILPNHNELHPNIDSILPIPLIRVHMCTLHAFVRIDDEMVYLSILFTWKKTSQDESKKTIEAIACVLTKVGFHGGHVEDEKDIKRLGTRGNILAKPSMSGVKASHFFEKKYRHRCWGLYEDLIDVEDYHNNGGRESARENKYA